jgi:hypothetical protein
MWFNEDFICVLTIGKTASSAIIQGLIDAGVPAYQAHTLHRAPQEYLFVEGLAKRPVQNALFQAKVRLWLSLTDKSPKKFVTTFRDPFSRNMSAFFEQSWKLRQNLDELDDERLMEFYIKHGPHDATRTWFADNLGKPFGISVKGVNLRDRGEQIVTAKQRRFLFLKYEYQKSWEVALGDFSGTPIRLGRFNDSTQKSYSSAMMRLKAAWRPSPEIVARSLDRELWDALYTSEEKEAIRDAWGIPQVLAP